MTREEAIEILWQYDVNFEPHPAEKVMHAIDMAIEALLKEAPSAEGGDAEVNPKSPYMQQSPNNGADLISRQDAIDAVIAEGRSVDSRYLEAERIVHESDAVEALSMLPSADRPTRHTLPDGTEIPIDEESYEIGYTHGQMADRPTGWIPCSERLPKEKEKVLTYDKYGDVDFGRYDKGQWYWEAEAIADYWMKDDGVVAWMPLPEPYREDGEA